MRVPGCTPVCLSVRSPPLFLTATHSVLHVPTLFTLSLLWGLTWVSPGEAGLWTSLRLWCPCAPGPASPPGPLGRMFPQRLMGAPASASTRLGWAVPGGLDSSLPLRVGNAPGLPITVVSWWTESRNPGAAGEWPKPLAGGTGVATEHFWHQDFWSPVNQGCSAALVIWHQLS